MKGGRFLLLCTLMELSYIKRSSHCIEQLASLSILLPGRAVPISSAKVAKDRVQHLSLSLSPSLPKPRGGFGVEETVDSDVVDLHLRQVSNAHH